MLLLRALFVFALLAGAARAAGDGAPLVLHLLDYVANDYAGAVREGKVVDPGEYQEQMEFVARAGGLIAQLPDHPRRAGLLDGTSRLSTLVLSKAPAQQVAAEARALHEALAAAYRVALAPRAMPDLKRGASLYRQSCASCHGTDGRGDGEAARGMIPPPTDFTDVERMAERSLFSLYNTITLGVSGTGMGSFASLPEADRWALAFHVAGMGQAGVAPPAGAVVKTAFSDMEALATALPREQAARGTLSDYAYLLRHPESLAGAQGAGLPLARALIRESADAAQRGDRAGAQTLALRAYLEGFETVEPALDAADGELRRRIEQAMAAYRAALGGAPAQALGEQAGSLDGLLEQAQARLDAPAVSAAGVFASAFVILFREGLEAVLLVAAIAAFLRKTERRSQLPIMHAGWIAALAAGGLTWWAASHFIAISGAQREMTEGITALLAAGVLVYVGLWLHSRAHADVWQKYLGGRLAQGGKAGRAWALFTVAFLATYREAFEVILFYQALWTQAAVAWQAFAAGIAAAIAALVVCAALILRLSVRLPLSAFFGASAWLLALLAVLFAGQGIAALQEAGAVSASLVLPLELARIGLQPSAEGLAAQSAVALALLAGMALASRRRTAAAQ